MPRSRTVLPGSLVDGLLSDLAAEQRAVPELAGQLKLDELRWNLDPARFRHSADANVAAAVAAAVSAAVDRAAALQALHGCSDDTLETMLECSAEWHCLTAGVWSAAAPESSAAGAGRAAALKQRHEESKRPVEPERQVTYLVQLLSDPAYSALSVHQRVHQLEALVPTHLLLLGRLDVQLATFHSGKPSLQQRLACARGAMVLATADHSRALEVLQRR